MRTYQLCTLKPSDYIQTFTTKDPKEALKRMWQFYDKRKEDIELLGYYNGKWIKLTDTLIYRSKNEKIKITSSSINLLERGN